MPRLGHYSEKYELNGAEQQQQGPATSYGSFRRDEHGALLSHDQLREEQIRGQFSFTANAAQDESQPETTQRRMHGKLRVQSAADQNAADDELESQTSDHGLVMGSMPRQAELFFRDGKRRIDYVLVYEDSEGTRLGKHDEWRSTFMANLRQSGLDMEEELVEGETKSVHFIKLSVPWPVLLRYAEELCLRAPLQAHPNPSVNWSATVLSTLRIPNIMEAEVPNKPLDYYTCTFKRSKLDRFLGSDNQDEYFTPTQRVCVAYEILQTARYGARRKAQIGIDRLIEEGVYAAAFPLHEGDYRKPAGSAAPSTWNRRQVLYEYWARWSRWYKYQPLDHIREYFGEKIGIYFAWLGFYTGWLLPAAAVGFLVFLYGIFTISNDGPTNEICHSDKKYRMCPRCDEKYGCDYWYISDNCIFTKITYLFDHPGTVFYAIFVSFWAVTFLEYWKRKSASLAHHWDCMDFEEEEERPRPEFAARAMHVERNPITGAKEPAFPARIRKQRIAAGVAILLLMIALVLVFMVSVIVYRVLVSIPLFRSQSFKGLASVIASSSGAFVNLIFIMILGKVYERLAYRLTQWEMHRTQTDFDNNLTLKVFLFQFVNFYSSIFYIAFFKGRFVGYPGNYGHLLGLRNEECSGSDCLSELAQQLAIIMVGKQIINNAQEILVPKVKAWWHRRKTKKVFLQESVARWEQDYQLIQNEGLFQEYLEMVLQFGFITIFVAAFPLAPLFALLNNWVEIRLDAQKFVCETRRCVPERAQNIGIWFCILEFLAKAAVISNAFLIAFTSDFLTRTMYRYEFDWDLKGYVNFTLAHAPEGSLSLPCRYRDLRDENGNWTFFHWKLLAVRLAFVIIFEHVVFCVCRLIDLVVPDIPHQLELKIKRERYLAKQALADSETIMKVAQRRDEEDEEETDAPAV